MFGKWLKGLLLVLAVAAALMAPHPATAQTSSNRPRPQAPQNVVYVVYYRNISKNGRWHVYGMYSSWSQANRARDFVNSFPQYYAYVATR